MPNLPPLSMQLFPKNTTLANLLTLIDSLPDDGWNIEFDEVDLHTNNGVEHHEKISSCYSDGKMLIQFEKIQSYDDDTTDLDSSFELQVYQGDEFCVAYAGVFSDQVMSRYVGDMSSSGEMCENVYSLRQIYNMLNKFSNTQL